MKDYQNIISNFNLAEEKNKLLKMMSTTRIWIRTLTGLLALVFGWLKFKGISIAPIATDAFSTTLLKISIILYFFSWIFGASSDVKDQAIVYLTAPNKGKIPKEAFGLMIALLIVFGIMCWVDSYAKFAAILLSFWVINLISWQYLIHKLVKKTIKISIELYEQMNHYAEIEKLEITKEYLSGSWQWWRFVIGGILIVFINMLIYTKMQDYFIQLSHITSSDFIIALSIFLFVIIVESWIWIMRVRRKVALNTIDRLVETYELNKK